MTLVEKDTMMQPMISVRLKKKRMQVGLSIRELARRTGLTASFISQVENSKANVSLDSLRRLSDALGVQMLYFLSEPFNGSEIQPPADAPEMAEGMVDAHHLIDRTYPLIKGHLRAKLFLPDSGITYELLTNRLDYKMEAFLGRMAPGTGNVGSKINIPTEEFIFVLEGVLKVGIRDQTYVVEAGDSIYFEGHALTFLASGSEKEETVWISVITPPAF